MRPMPLMIAATALAGILPVQPAHACEPIIPLAMLYSGTNVWSLIATTSAVAMFVVVGIKCMVFAWKSDYKPVSAVLFMLLANVYSTLPGLILTVFFSSPLFIVFSFIAYYPFARFMIRHRPLHRFSKGSAAALLALLTFLTAILFWVSQALVYGYLGWYWLVKISYSTIAIGISFYITTVCEEAVVSWLYERVHKESRSFMQPVIWANVVVFLLVTGTAAAFSIPKRLASPDFLLSLLKTMFV